MSGVGARLRIACMLSGLALSASFRVWRFFIPYQFRWYSYIPEAPRNLIVSIDWTNFFLALLPATPPTTDSSGARPRPSPSRVSSSK